MDLRDIREQVIIRSGRNDLVGELSTGLPDYAIDAGVDKFIEQGQRFLCDRAPWLCPEAIFVATLESGETSIRVPLLKEVQKVVCTDTSAENAINLSRDTYRVMQEFLLELGAAPDSGAPTAFALTESYQAPLYQSNFLPDVDGWSLSTAAGLVASASAGALVLAGTAIGTPVLDSPVFAAYSLGDGEVKVLGYLSGDFYTATLIGVTTTGTVNLLTIEHSGYFEHRISGSTIADYTGFQFSFVPEAGAITVSLSRFAHGISAPTLLTIDTTADTDYQVSVLGRYYPRALHATGDENFITQTHPYFLISAALYILETSYGSAALEELTILERQLVDRQTDWTADRMKEWEDSDGLLTLGGETDAY